MPSLTNTSVKALIQRLSDLGVTEYSHLNLVEEKDITDVVKIIQARLLIQSWKSKGKLYYVFYILVVQDPLKCFNFKTNLK